MSDILELMRKASEPEEKKGDLLSLMKKASEEEEPEILEPELAEPEAKPSIFDRIKGLGAKVLPRLETMGGPKYTQAKMMLEKGVEQRLVKDMREAELAKRRPEMAPEVPTLTALAPEQKRGYETGESLRKYLWLYPPEVKKEAAGIFKDPKVNYYADKIADRLPLWLTAFAGAPAIIGIFEMITQVKNVTASLAEGSKYDPLASRQLSEFIPEDAPEWFRVAASIGEGAADMIFAAIAAKKIKFAGFKYNMERALNYAEKIGYPKDLVGVWRKAVADSAGDISRFRSLEKEIQTMMKSTKTMRSPMMRGISEVVGAPETAIRPPEIAPKAAPRLMPPATRIATERGTIFDPKTPEAERLAAMYREVEPTAPETKVNISPKADGSIDVVWTKPPAVEPPAVEPAPVLDEKKEMLESIWATFEQHPRVIWKDLVKYAEGNEEIATPREIAEYFESRGKEVIGKPKPPEVAKEKKPITYEDSFLQDIHDIVGKIKPNPDYSRAELMKILPLRMIGAKGDPAAKEMDIAAQLLKHKYPGIEGNAEFYDMLVARKRAPVKREVAEKERVEAEFEEFKEREKPPEEAPPAAVAPPPAPIVKPKYEEQFRARTHLTMEKAFGNLRTADKIIEEVIANSKTSKEALLKLRNYKAFDEAALQADMEHLDRFISARLKGTETRKFSEVATKEKPAEKEPGLPMGLEKITVEEARRLGGRAAAMEVGFKGPERRVKPRPAISPLLKEAYDRIAYKAPLLPEHKKALKEAGIKQKEIEKLRRFPEELPEVEEKPIKAKAEKEKPLILQRYTPMAKAIEKALKEKKPLTEEQKEFLKEKGMYEEKKLPERVELPEPEIEKLPERVALVKVSVETPTGEIEELGELTADRVDKIKEYAKQMGIEGKLKIGTAYKGKWGEHLNPQEIEKYMKEVIRDVKKVPREEWELYSGYPFTKEIKEAISRIRERTKTKKRVKLEELKGELQKTDKGKVEWMYLESERLLAEKRKPSFKRAFRGAKRALVDTSGNVKRDLIKDMGPLGKEAVIHHDLIAGANSKAERLFAEASKKIYSKISKADEDLLNRTIQSRRTVAISDYRKVDEDAVNALEAQERILAERIERWGGKARAKAERELEKVQKEKAKLLARGIRHPHGLTGEQHEEFLKDIPKEIDERADAYFKEMENVLDDSKSEGLLDEESCQNLKSKGVYSPRRFIQYIDPERTYVISGKTITIPDSGIKALDTGSQQVMETNSRLLLSSVISRTQARIFRNRANKAGYDLAKEIPDNGIFKLAKVIGTTKEGKPIYQEAPAGHAKIKVMVDGKAKEMLMPDEYAKEWLTRDPLINEQMATMIGWISGSKLLKPMATGLNPGFALTNFPRDIGHIFIVTSEYSSFFPKFSLQMMKDLEATKEDAFLRKGTFIDYVNEGGMMTFLTLQGKPFKNANEKIMMAQKVMGYTGETSEIWPRLAIRRRAIINGKSPHEATWIARNYLDFNQGGNVMKALDTGLPYLNAGTQGTRGIFRALADRPYQTLWKFAQLAALASGLYLANRYSNKECWDHIPDRDKVNNFCITTPFSFKDKNQNERFLYFKIAKDQGQRVVCTIFENMMAKALGEEVNADQITQSIQEFLPIIPSQNIPPSIDAMMGYYANKDFWTNKDIWRGDKITPREEYTAYTHPALVKTGQVTALSPERLGYSLSQVFTRGNVYTSIVGAGFSLAMKDLPEKDKRKTAIETVTRLPLIKRVFKATPAYSEAELKKLEKIETEESTRRYKQKRELTEISSRYYTKLKDEKIKDRSILTEVKVFIRKQPAEDRKRLISWFKNYGIVFDIPDKTWWLNMAEMPPEARAQVYWTKYLETEEGERKALSRLAKRIPGLWSDRFNKRLRILINKWKKEQ